MCDEYIQYVHELLESSFGDTENQDFKDTILRIFKDMRSVISDHDALININNIVYIRSNYKSIPYSLLIKYKLLCEASNNKLESLTTN